MCVCLCTWASLSCLASSSLDWVSVCSSMRRSSTVLSACLHCSCARSRSWISSSSVCSLSLNLYVTYAGKCIFLYSRQIFWTYQCNIYAKIKCELCWPLPAVDWRSVWDAGAPDLSPASSPPAPPHASAHPHAVSAADWALFWPDYPPVERLTANTIQRHIKTMRFRSTSYSKTSFHNLSLEMTLISKCVRVYAYLSLQSEHIVAELQNFLGFGFFLHFQFLQVAFSQPEFLGHNLSILSLFLQSFLFHTHTSG